jgi:hypothetical protein
LFFPKRKYRLFFFNLQGIAQKNFILNTQKDNEDNKKEVLDSKFTMRWALGIKRQFKCGKMKRTDKKVWLSLVFIENKDYLCNVR